MRGLTTTLDMIGAMKAQITGRSTKQLQRRAKEQPDELCVPLDKRTPTELSPTKNYAKQSDHTCQISATYISLRVKLSLHPAKQPKTYSAGSTKRYKKHMHKNKKRKKNSNKRRQSQP